VMQILKNKSKVYSVSLLLVLTIAATLVALPAANAHTPPWNVPTYAFIVASPNPVGVGQTAVVIFWLDKLPPTAAGAGGDRWRNLKVEVTKPNGDKQTLGPFTSDPAASGWTSYTPDQVGTYTFVFSFPGQVVSLYGPTGIPGSSSAYINDTYLASSATTTLTVQQEQLPEPITYPLPTEYWTRPIEGQNTEWYRVASNWLIGAHIPGRFQPDGIAPDSPHIMWTKPLSFGGVVGGTKTGILGATYYSGLSYEGKFYPIIMDGRLYYSLPRSNSPSGGGFVCVDLRTGEELWWKNYTTSPSKGQLYWYDSPNQHGVIPNGYLWAEVGPRSGPFTWEAYDPLTGDWLFTLTDVPAGTEVYTDNGEIVRYVLDVAGKWLGLWNNTCEQQGLHGGLGTGSSAWQWRPVGKTVDMSQAYSWNVSIPWLPTGATIVSVIHDDLLLGRNGTLPSEASWEPYTMWAMSLKPETRGQLLWMEDYAAPPGNMTWRQGPVDPETRVFTISEEETRRYYGYSIDNGALLWGPTPSEHPLDFYSKLGTTQAEVCVAYGRLYTASYGGIAHCYDLKNGKLLWTYNNTVAGLYAPWPNYPLLIGAIADGKVYLYTTEHSPGSPYYKGVRIRCVTADKGEELWTMFGAGSGGHGARNSFAVADGYLIYLNFYDMQIYCIGKGPSAVTVDAPLTAIPLGSSVVIRGTVTDVSSGTKQLEQAARFPNGVSAISDADMGPWMETVYMQKPCPAYATGVEVTLDAVDPNNNWIHIGRVTSDLSGMFKKMWTPDIEGEYTVIATFEGSESYYASYAETAIGVDPAPEEPVTPATPEGVQEDINESINSLTPMFMGIIAAVVVVAILVLYTLYTVRKQRK